MKVAENMHSQAMHVARRTLTLVALMTLSSCVGPIGPEQPTSGPGGTDYLFDFVAPVVTGGALANKWAVYEPTLEENERVPAPGPCPLSYWCMATSSFPTRMITRSSSSTWSNMDI